MESRSRVWSVFAVILLACILSLMAFDMVNDRRQRNAKQQVVSEMLVEQRAVVNDLLSDYESLAYGSTVDRIAEQQLIAEEHQLAALQIVALQNTQIMEILASE